MVTREFFSEARERLTPEGVLIYNSPYDLGAVFTDSIVRTIATVFPEQYVFGTEMSNALILGVVQPRQLTREALVARAEEALARGTIKVPDIV